ncbi:MAG TPA: DUF192 domain-containing protein [Beijerinckiaceae bacterium]|nr:DUF192 domain-containing protein [Beijerinckiaceae bacterium]
MGSDTAGARPFWQRAFLVLFVVVTLGVSGYSIWSNLARQDAQAQSRSAAIAQGMEELSITTARDSHRFLVEVMRTDAERAKGLMFRQSMPHDHGMLFDFKMDAPVAMWMKNTYIPLDMLFITADGTIARIERRTEPHSERTIASGGPVRAVLELNGGTAERLNLKPGDRVKHAMFPAK